MSLALVGLMALVALGAGLAGFVRLPPRHGLAALLFGIAAALGLLRMLPLALPLAGVALAVWRSAGPLPADLGAAAPGRTSRVRSRNLEMCLDHDSGVMSGEVTGGPFAGRSLDGLTDAELRALAAWLADEGDAEGATLLAAWIERHRPGAAGAAGPEAEAPARGELSEAEALDILGLKPGASRGEVREAHRRLMRRLHPDQGGTAALATLLNRARQRLDP